MHDEKIADPRADDRVNVNDKNLISAQALTCQREEVLEGPCGAFKKYLNQGRSEAYQDELLMPDRSFGVVRRITVFNPPRKSGHWQ